MSTEQSGAIALIIIIWLTIVVTIAYFGLSKHDDDEGSEGGFIDGGEAGTGTLIMSPEFEPVSTLDPPAGGASTDSPWGAPPTFDYPIRPKPAGVDHEIPVTRKSLDEEYAAAHGMWVCDWCETINDNAMHSCAACGAQRL